MAPAGHRSPATPQRPRFSSNTRTTAQRTIELEGGVSIDPGDRLALPVRAKLGLNSASEAYVEWSPLQLVNAPGSDQTGIGDVLLGYRQRFREGSETRPALAFQMEAKIPTADHDKGLGSGETDLFTAFAAEQQLKQLRLGGFYQLGLLGEVGDGTVDLQHGLAVVATQSIDSRIDVFGEGAFVWTPERDDEQLFATMGATYSTTPSLVFDVSVVLGLTGDTPDFMLLFGLTQNFGHRHRARAVATSAPR